MKTLLLLVMVLTSMPLYAQSKHQLERLNFYPAVKSYVRGNFEYKSLRITTPQSTVSKKEVENFYNVFHLSYAHHLKYFFLGIETDYEIASESAANYGIPSDERYSSHAFKDLQFFLFSRLRPQKDEQGNIDFLLSFVDTHGSKEVGNSSANRLEGRNILRSMISHGYLEEDWEFKNSLMYTFYDEGEEHNDFTQTHNRLGSYNMFNYFFSGQYRYNDWWYFNGEVGVEYRTPQKIAGSNGDKRELQSGTGSIFRAGVKKPLGPLTILGLTAELRRYSYFVKGVSNFDGDATQYSLMLSFIQGF